MTKKTSCCLLVLSLIATPLFAERILLKNKAIVDGKIVKETKSEVYIDIPRTGVVQFARTEILEIRRDKHTQSTLKAGPNAGAVPSELPEPTATPAVRGNEANRIGNEGIALVTTGHYEKGMGMIRQAIQKDPSNPAWHMNYGSLAMQKASSMVPGPDRTAIVKEIEPALVMAIDRFDAKKDKAVIAHCYYLIGDTRLYGAGDRDGAKRFYLKSIEFNPHEKRALAALAKLDPMGAAAA